MMGLFINGMSLPRSVNGYSVVDILKDGTVVEHYTGKVVGKASVIKYNGDLIARNDAIDSIMGEPPDAHYPGWFAANVERVPAVIST